MTAWEYGELIAESLSVNDEGEWMTKGALTWHSADGSSGPTSSRTMSGSALAGLNQLGSHGWEVAGVSRTHLEDKFRIKIITVYVVKRAIGRQPRPTGARESGHAEPPVAA